MKIIRKVMLACLIGLFFLYGKSIPAHGAQPVVVVIDPGHGGENLGAECNGYTEKNLTMIVALAMKEELEKYEGIEVYLTREGDKDMSLEERAEFAASKNADFLFCLHFNMSAEHDLFGSEVWVSAFGEEHQEGYSFASGEMELLEEMGLYPRGIKTRLNDRGEDYYGIIRHSTARGIPSALIEHCHLDQENDTSFYTSGEGLESLGILDATAVARYYGLKSEILGVDYSGWPKVEIPVPTGAVKPDLTEPDVCMIDVGDVNTETGDIEVSVYASDYDSYLLYYSYSWDGGKNFSDLQKWEPRSADNLTFTMKAPPGTIPEVVVKVYNKYDIKTESNHVYLPSIASEKEREEESGAKAADGDTAEEDAGGEVVEAGIMKAKNPADNGKEAGKNRKGEAPEVTFFYFLQVAFLCVAILFVLLMLTGILMRGRVSSRSRISSRSRRSRISFRRCGSKKKRRRKK